MRVVAFDHQTGDASACTTGRAPAIFSALTRPASILTRCPQKPLRQHIEYLARHAEITTDRLGNHVMQGTEQVGVLLTMNPQFGIMNFFHQLFFDPEISLQQSDNALQARTEFMLRRLHDVHQFPCQYLVRPIHLFNAAQ